MPSKSETKREDEVLRRMLKMPPKPHVPLKAKKPSPSRVIRVKKSGGGKDERASSE